MVSTDILGEIRISSLANEGVELHINASAQHVHDLFEYCDLAILSASTSYWRLLLAEYRFWWDITWQTKKDCTNT